MLDLTPFKKALEQLDKSLAFCNSDLAEKDSEIFLQFRSAAIQAFEYTYEISVKMLKRHLENIEASADTIDHLSYKNLIRTGAEKGLIDDPVAWFNFREKRNITSHAYDEDKAENVYEILPEFSKKAHFLFEQLNSTK